MRRCIIACKAVEEEFRRILPPGVELRGLEQGLHRAPEKLRESLQREIDSIDADEILLGYGNCGNGVVGLKSRTARLIVPRVDDCISLLLGSYERYKQEFEKEPGTYWLSHGWIEHSEDPLKEYERVKAKWDEETARWVAHETMKGYHRMALISTWACPLDQLRGYANRFAAFFDLEYQEMDGTGDLFHALVSDEHAEDGFVVVQPGEEITAEMFLPSVGLPNG